MENNSCTVFGKPVSNTEQSIFLSPEENTQFSFSTEEITNLREVDGALEIKFDNGSVLLVENFETLAKAGMIIQLSDFTDINTSNLYDTLTSSGTLQATAQNSSLFLAEPAADTTQEIKLEEGQSYKLGFDLGEADAITQENGHLVIDFKEGGVLVLRDFAEVTEGRLPPEMTLADGTVIKASDLIISTEFAQVPGEEELADLQSDMREQGSAQDFSEDMTAPEMIEPAAGEAQAEINLDGARMSEAALEAAQIEPAAGDAGAAAGGRGGFGFQSSPQAAPLGTPSAIGPIDPTALKYVAPDFDEDVYPDLDLQENTAPSASLTVEDTVIKEDGSQALTIHAANDSGSDVSMVLTVTGIPSTWTVTGPGSYDPITETWTLQIPAGQSFVGGPTLYPPADSDIDLPDLDVKLVATDSVTGLQTTETDTLDVIVDAVADDPTIDAADASGMEGDTLPVDVIAAAGDMDGSEIITGYEITGVPAGFTFNAGTDLGGGVWSFTPADIVGLEITPPSDYVGGLGLNVTVLTTENPVSDGEKDYLDNDNQASDDFCLCWKPEANPPEIIVNEGVDDAVVKEDGTVDVPIDAWLDSAASGNEILTVTVTGIDASWGFSAPVGTYDSSTGTWTVTLPAGANLSTMMTFTPPADTDIDLTGLVATAVAYEPASGTSASDTDDFNVIVDAVADTPDLTTHNASGEEGSTISLSISTNVTDLDGSESIDVVRITNVPAGATLTAGTEISAGVWELSVSDLSGLGINVPDGMTGGYTLNVESVATETPVSDGEYVYTDNEASAYDTITLCITEDDEPVVEPEERTVDETNLGPITINDSIYADFGNDGPGTFSTNGGFTSSVTLTSNGVPVIVSNVGNMYIGTAGADVIFMLTLDIDGDYTFELNGVIDHPDTTDHNDSVALQFGITATDSEGDGTNGLVTINVLDDGLEAHDDLNAFDFATGSTDGNVITGENGGPGAEDDLSNDVDNTVTEVIFGSTTYNVPETGSITINGTYGSLEISANGEYEYTLYSNGIAAHNYEETLSFPTLTEAQAISGSTLDNLGVYADDLLATSHSVGSVTFVSEGAGYNNTLGMYTIAADGTLQAATVMIENGNAASVGDSYNFTAESGEEVAFFIIADGYDTNAGYAGVDLSNGTLAFVYKYGTAEERPANIADDGADISLVYTDGTTSVETVLQGDIYHTTERGSVNNLNTDDSVRVVSGLADTSDSTTLRIGFEDLPNLGDEDYQDIIFDVCFTSYCQSDEFTYVLTDADGDTSEALLSFECNGTPVDVEVEVNHGVNNVIVKEDSSVNVDVDASTTGGNGNEVVTLLLTGVAASWGFSATGWAATGNPGEYSITLPAGQTTYNGVFTFTPPADSDIDLTGLSVTASVYDPDTLQTVDSIDDFDIIVDAVADTPDLTTHNASGEEGSTISLSISTNVTDLDGSESIDVVRITNVPAGATLTAGTEISAGVWELSVSDLSGLGINVPDGMTGGYTLNVESVATETPVSDGEDVYTDNEASAYDTICLCICPDEDPDIKPEEQTVDESNLGPVIVNDSIYADFGNDGPGTFSTNGGFTSSVTLTSNGVPVIVSNVGNMYIGTAGAEVIFTLVLNANGDYTFELNGVIDHPDTTDHNDSVALQFGITATDSEGDGTNGLVTINVLDDGLEAHDDVNTYQAVDRYTEGNVITGENGGVGAADDLSNDVDNTVTEISFGSTTVVVPQGGSTVISGHYGDLEIFSNGHYEYTLTALPGTAGAAAVLGAEYADTIGISDSITKNGITVSVANTGNYDISWVNTADGSGYGIDNLSSSDSTKVWPKGEGFDISFDSDVNEVTLVISELGDNNNDGAHGLDYVVTLSDGSTVSGEQQFVAADIVNGTYSFDLSSADFGGLLITSINITSVDSGQYLGASFLLNDVMIEYPGHHECPVDVFEYTLIDADGDTSTATLTLDAECPDVTIDVKVNQGVDDVCVKEDGTVDVDIQASTAGGNGNEVVTLLLTGVAASWGFTATGWAATGNPGEYSITLPAGQTTYTGEFTFAPPADSDVDLTGLNVTASVYDPDTLQTATDTDSFNVNVDAVADDPTIDATGGVANEGQPIDIDVTAAVTDLDGSESITGYEISNVPTGFTFNAGTNLGGGVWSFTPAQIAGLEVTPTNGYVGSLSMSVTVLTEETTLSGKECDTTDNTNEASDCICLCWKPVVNPPEITVNNGVDDVCVKEDGTVNVDIEANLGANGSGNEILTVTVTGIDASWGFSAPVGTYNASTGTWTYTLPANTNFATTMTFSPPADSDIDLTGLVATATAYEPATGTTATDTDSFNVNVDAVADDPTIDATGGVANEGQPIDIDVTAAVTDLDGSESITGYEISNVPTGFTFNAGTNLGGGVWSFTPAQIAGLEVTPTNGYVGSLSMSVTVLTEETTLSGKECDTTDNTNEASDCICLCWKPVVNPPEITVNNGVDDVCVKEDGTVNVDIEANLGANGSGNEILTVTVTGIDASWGFSAPVGTYNASTGTWTYTLPANTNFATTMTFSPPADSDIDLTGLVATATAYEPATGTTATDTDSFNVNVDAVIDTPVLDLDCQVCATVCSAYEYVDLDISASVTDLDGSEEITKIVITIPSCADALGMELNHGTEVSPGVWELTQADLTDLAIKVTPEMEGSYSINVTAYAEETNLSGQECDYTDNDTSVSDSFCLYVDDGTNNNTNVNVNTNVNTNINVSSTSSFSSFSTGEDGTNDPLASGLAALQEDGASLDQGSEDTSQDFSGLLETGDSSTQTAINNFVSGTETEEPSGVSNDNTEAGSSAQDIINSVFGDLGMGDLETNNVAVI